MSDRRTVENCQEMREMFLTDYANVSFRLYKTPKHHKHIRRNCISIRRRLRRAIVELNTEIAIKVYASNPYAH
jgi:hypothetical protein